MLSGRPLLDTVADSPFHVSRPDAEAAARFALEQGLNLLVLGQRGAGKTTFLRRLAFDLRTSGSRVAFVDAGPADGNPDEVLALVTDVVTGRQRSMTLTDSLFPPSPTESLLARVDRLRSRLSSDEQERVVVLVDGLGGSTVHTLFGQLRDELWTVPVSWVVSGDLEQRAAYLRPPADAFFDAQVVLGPLPDGAAEQLVARRLDDAPSLPALTHLVRGTDRMPRTLVAAARGFAGSTAAQRSGQAAAREQARLHLAGLGRAATMLVEELRARGGSASASEPDLLGRLGWTRPRAVQVLKQLEDAGLATTSSARVSAQGRPRTIYTLVPDLL
jgi:energy-coupling factor transporter ATP-binding protein EcfA2